MIGKKHGQRTLSSKGKSKKFSKAHEYSCGRFFCYYCISLNFEQNPKDCSANSSWVCPYCQVL